LHSKQAQARFLGGHWLSLCRETLSIVPDSKLDSAFNEPKGNHYLGGPRVSGHISQTFLGDSE